MSKQSDIVNVSQGDTLAIDHTLNRVGIRVPSPSYPLDVAADDVSGVGVSVRSNIDNLAYLNFTNSEGTSAYATVKGSGFSLDLSTTDITPINLKTSNTTRMSIDGSGRVTMPYQPAFSAFFSVSSPTPYTAGSRVLNFTTVSYNVGSHYDGTNKFTAPVAGRYVFSVNRALNTFGANQVIRHPSMGFQVNGTDNYGVNTGVSTSSGVGASDYTHFTVSMTTVLNLNANDYVQVNFNYANSPSTLYEYASSWFTGYYLG